ncbi:alpha/beta hydrolase [Agrococcus terreus]|uniref:alpha/beta hydrolase n=1 Tax=Agrococcus terreus TaxID=574649 RepID=UPI00384D60F3
MPAPDDERYLRHVRPTAARPARTEEAWAWERWLVHVEHVGDADAPVRMLVVHGAGGNAAAMRPFAEHLAAQGALVTAIDLPGYGRTRPSRRGDLVLDDWRRLLVHAAERLDDGRPLVLVGASMGGMLALDAAASSGRDDLVIATCLLDLSDAAVRRRVVRAPLLGALAPALLRLAVGPLRRVRLPLRWIVPMERIANDPALAAEVLRDGRGGRTAMPLGWYRTLLAAPPVVAPERLASPPVLLLHPADDRWTPTAVSAALLARIAAPTRLVELPGSGHFPVEEPGISLLLAEAGAAVRALAEGRAPAWA